jgi:hypothetical protein
MANKLKKILFFLLSATLFPAAAHAYDFVNSTGLNTTAQATGHTSQPLFGSQGSLEYGIAVILNVALSFLGVVFLILIVFAGVKWMIAKGNDEKVKMAKEILEDAIIGLVIVAAAYAISYFVLGSFINNLQIFQ